MSHESTVIVLPPSGPVQELFPPPPPAQQLDMPPTPSAEQVRAVEAVFAQEQKESGTVAGLLGLYTSTVFLHNLAVDTFGSRTEEVKRKPRLKVEEEPEE